MRRSMSLFICLFIWRHHRFIRLWSDVVHCSVTVVGVWFHVDDTVRCRGRLLCGPPLGSRITHHIPSVRLHICPVPTVNSKTEHYTTLKLWREVTQIRRCLQNNVEVKSLKVKVNGAEMWKSFLRIYFSVKHVKRGPWRPHCMLHVSSSTMQ